MKRKYRIIAAIVCLVMCLAFVALFITDAYAADPATSIVEDQEELKSLQARLKAIKQKRNGLKSDSEASGDSYENAYAEKIALEHSISLLEEEIAITSSLVEDYDTLILGLEQKMFERQTEIDRLYDMYDKVVVYYYKNGNPTSMQLLLESDSLSSYLTKKDYLSYILDYMQKIRKDIQSAKSELEATGDTYRSARTDLDNYVEGLNKSKSECDEQVAELNTLMEGLTGDIEMTQAQIDAYDKQASELEKEIAELNKAIQQKETYLEGSCISPFDSYYLGVCRLTSPFGFRTDPFTGERAYHNGYDIAAPAGTPVHVVKAGTVIRSEFNENGYGNVIVVAHGDGTSTLYGHLSKRLVFLNDKVLQDQVIGKVGTTGRSNGNHLHFTVYLGDTVTDPGKYLPEYMKKAIDIYGYLD